MLTLSLFVLCTTVVFAQQKPIKGTVVDATGEPLIGVNVSVKGTTIGTITDVDGKYSLEVPAKGTLVFSFIGYKTAEIPIGSQSVVDQTLNEDTQNIDEVVVVGYGVQKKASLTGAVATLKGEELKASPTTNLTNGMVGRMPGVIGFQRSDEPGGGGTTIRIRGTNSLGSKDPLIVIDGVPGRAGGLDRINPNEIESISVLKDAAAAIYGSRAANGVVLVTTKRGKEGKPTITYTGNMGFASPTRLPEVCDAYEYSVLLNEISTNAGGSPKYTAEDLELFRNGQDPWGHPNTNWYDEAIKNVSPIYRHDVSISGGSDKFKFYLNLAANGEDGIYKKSANRYDQYSIRANIDAKINQYIDLSYGTISRMEIRHYPTYGATDIFSALVRSKPNQTGYWPSGEPGPDIEYGHNPVVMGTDATGKDNQKDYYLQNTLKINIKIPGVEGLTLTGSGTYDKYFKNRHYFKTPYMLYSWDGNEEHKLSAGQKGPATPELTEERTDQTFWMANAVANYNRTFGDHTIGVTVGLEAEKRDQNFVKAFRKYFLSSSKEDMDLGGVSEMTNSGNSWKEARLNYFGRVSYNYLERYLVEFVWRADGSYRFPTNKRYGFFPGVSAAWRVSEEGWWKENVRFIDYFKLRGSISQTGNDALVDTNGNLDRSIQYLNTYKFAGYYLYGNSYAPYLEPTRTPNPNITWEVGTTYNVGLDFKFLQNRLSWETDAFYHKRTNMLIYRNASLPETSGITLPRENLGEMCNRGFESLISWQDRAGKVNYNASINMTYAKNKILYWDEVPGVPEYQQSTGNLANTDLYYVYDGVFKDQADVDATKAKWSGARPGDIKFKDVNGDGKIDADDRVRSKRNSEPKFVAGITLGANWNNFDFMMLFQGAVGGETYVWRERAGEAGNFYKETYENRWTPENPSSVHPRIFNRENEYWVSNRNTYYLKNTDYLRLKNLEIGYTFNLPGIQKAGISNLRIYANATNLFTIDGVKVQDPEANDTGREYPQRRVVNFGATITF
ncbi:SusC/RagA family TonB-linked outer membrane protein [uncultured Parabacteroides sp.]|uniref:SusC/RagA family TonB-linked outer membrane protein n=1 Tax=uncultured Parabacteroides sp. TaxID=512312 RepID=UPI002605C9FA|nr:TonB-dependent receptor [uncultured Parabacteroides sp.]